jgi:glycosyltransferase involved in cell wall biosynthesis
MRDAPVVQVSWQRDPERRPPGALLEAWPTLRETAAAAVRAGAQVIVVQAAHENAEIERDDVRFEFVRTKQASPLRRRIAPWSEPADDRMLDRIATLQPGIVHQHGLTHPLHARAIAGRVPRTPLLVQDHASRPSRRAARVYRWGLARASAIAFTAKEQAEPFFAAGALPRGMRVVELLESSTRFTPGDREAARAATGIHGDPCVLWLGHLDANKDPITALAAFAEAATALPGARLWMAYRHAPLLAEVEERIAGSEALRERVRLIGPQQPARVEQLLRAADCLVQASRFESCGYVVIEALACGTTPLVTDIPSLRRITGSGAVGGLFPPGDAAALAGLLVAHASSDLAERRAAARAHFERSLSFQALGRELVAVYASLLDATAAGQDPATTPYGHTP